MSEPAELGVWLRSSRVGVLRELAGRRLEFQYEAEHLVAPASAPLSVSLPLREAPFDDAAARPFFANLLPDAGLREAVARKLGLSPRNDFALLGALGGECAGAISLLPPGASPDPSGEYVALTDEDFARLIDDLPRRPLMAGERGVRLSLAGAQGKLPVRFDAGRFSVVRGGVATTHIVKPAIPHVEESVRNEAFCMALAARAGLSVPPSWAIPGPPTVYVVERFDRHVGRDGVVVRDHAEDFCQALGYHPEVKYQSEGGPGLTECFGLLERHSARPAADRLALLRWTGFNALVQNADAHAKNVSLLHASGGVRLAPFYDLLSTGVYEEVGNALAMKIGGEGRPQWIRRRHWERMADEVQIGRRLVLDVVGQLAASLPGLAEALEREQGGALGPSRVVTKVVALVRERCQQAERELKGPGAGPA